jgi:acyl CoA:acetate/3-ketoacid CoA transferase alpha subunit
VINKALANCNQAVANVFDGATIMIGGFGEPGVPGRLIEALRQQGRPIWSSSTTVQGFTISRSQG